MLNPLDGLEDDPGGDPEEGGPVHQRRKDLPALVAEGLVVGGGPEGDPPAEKRETERSSIGEHMAGVGQQSQRAADPAADCLDQHEHQGQAQYDSQAGQRGSGAV